MKLQAQEQGNTWQITTPTGEIIEEVQSVVEGYMPGYGPYLSVHLRLPLGVETLPLEAVDAVVTKEETL